MYARLDFRANHTFTYNTRRMTLFFEVLNVLGRTNYAPANGRLFPSGQVFGVTDKLFPFLPSAGLLIEF